MTKIDYKQDYYHCLLETAYLLEDRCGSWKASIRNSSWGIKKRIKESPSLRKYPAELIEECYIIVRENAAD